MSVSLPMVPHYYGSFLLSSSDTLLLKFFLITTSQIGYYGFAASFGGLMAMAVGAINTAASPIIYEQIKLKNYDSVRSLTWTLQFLLLILSSIGCFWLKEVFEIMVNNKELRTAYFLAAIFIMSHNYRPMYFGVASILFYRERTYNLWKVTFGAGLICVLLNVLFIPIYGIKSPAYVLFFSYLIMGYGTFFLNDYKEVAVTEFKPLRWLLITIFSFIIVLLVIDLPIVYKFFVSLLYVIIIFLFFFKIKNNIFLRF